MTVLYCDTNVDTVLSDSTNTFQHLFTPSFSPHLNILTHNYLKFNYLI